jgi:hypothetical protein
MKKASKLPFQPFKINGKVVNLQEKDQSIGVKANTFVKYFPSIKSILAGEFIDADKKNENSRNSVITSTNLISGNTCKKTYNKKNNVKPEFSQADQAASKPFIW